MSSDDPRAKIPGFGWSKMPASSGAVTFMEGSDRALTELEYDTFPGLYPGLLVNRFASEFEQEDATLDATKLADIISRKFRCYFASKGLNKQADELIESRISNNRPMRWVVMIIKPNSTFKFHAHPNVEFIYVIKGKLFEFRLQTTVEKDYNASSDGPDLRPYGTSDFKANSVSECDPVAGTDPIEDVNRFIINEIGSCHLSYTKEEGCVLLVLWGGSHSNVPMDQYPAVSIPVAVEEKGGADDSLP